MYPGHTLFTIITSKPYFLHLVKAPLHRVAVTIVFPCNDSHFLHNLSLAIFTVSYICFSSLNKTTCFSWRVNPDFFFLLRLLPGTARCIAYNVNQHHSLFCSPHASHRNLLMGSNSLADCDVNKAGTGDEEPLLSIGEDEGAVKIRRRCCRAFNQIYTVTFLNHSMGIFDGH